MSLEEHVLCVPRQALPAAWLERRTALPLPYERCLEILAAAGCCYKAREEVERDPGYKQIIPYVVALDPQGPKVGCYQRKGSEKRLHGRASVGLGGHVTREDARTASDGLGSVLACGLRRELSEEFVALPEPYHLSFRGIINEEESAVGEVHLGLVFRMDVSSPEALRPGAELHRFQWIPLSQADRHPLELWSRLALKIL
jgi:predicted NUDIX family phosphoesterase